MVVVVATLYRCPTPTDWLCPCGTVARALRREGIAHETEVVGRTALRASRGRSAQRTDAGAPADHRRRGDLRFAAHPRAPRVPALGRRVGKAPGGRRGPAGGRVTGRPGEGAHRLPGGRGGDTALGDQSRNQCRRRDIEGGIATGRAGGCDRAPADVRDLDARPLLDRRSRPRWGSEIDRRGRPGDDERDPGRRRGERMRVRADLVGHVSVGGHPVTPDDHRIDRSCGDQARRGAVDDQFVCDPEPVQVRRRSAGRPAAAGGSRSRARARGRDGHAARRSPPARCPVPARPARPCCNGSGAGARRRGARRRPAAIAALERSSSSCSAMAAANAAAAPAPSRGPRRGRRDAANGVGEIGRGRRACSSVAQASRSEPGSRASASATP